MLIEQTDSIGDLDRLLRRYEIRIRSRIVAGLIEVAAGKVDRAPAWHSGFTLAEALSAALESEGIVDTDTPQDACLGDEYSEQDDPC